MAAAVLIPLKEASSLAPFLGRVRSYVHQSRSKNTLRGYRADWRNFCEFTEALGADPMPARPEVVSSYLSACADSGMKAGSIQRRLSAIAAMHSAAGYDSPTARASVKLCLAGIRRALGTRQQGKTPALTADIAAMCSHLPPGLLGTRDRALLLFGFAGAFWGNALLQRIHAAVFRTTSLGAVTRIMSLSVIVHR